MKEATRNVVMRRRILANLIALAIPLFLGVASAHAQEAAEADRVHFLVAVDFPYAHAAKELGLDLDRDGMKKVIQDSMQANGFSEGLQGKYTLTVLDGQKMSEKQVLDYYRRLKIGGNETLVFYYSGHGGFHPEKGHLLAMRNFYNMGGGKQIYKGASVDRKELLVAMARNNPRAMIVLTDCCSTGGILSLPGEKVDAPNAAFKTRLKGMGKGEVFRDLFFRSRGVVNITAARTGTSARGDRKKGGSHFTVALTSLLNENRQFFHDNAHHAVEWREFFPGLTTLTQLESDRILTNNAGKKFHDFHTPEAFVLAEPIQKAKGALPSGGKPAVLEKDDTLTRSDPTYKKGDALYFIKNFPVKMVKGRAYLISLHSSHFDTFLFVKDPTNAKTLAFNDDYGNTTTRSRILFFPPATGTYDVGVSSYGAGETGDFSLIVQESTCEDKLSPLDAKDSYCLGSFAKRHPVHLKAMHSYTIRLESEDTGRFDPFLRIVDEYGNTVAFNDDEDEAQGRLNSCATFRTVSSGTFYIVATSYRPGETGRYAVFIQE